MNVSLIEANNVTASLQRAFFATGRTPETFRHVKDKFTQESPTNPSSSFIHGDCPYVSLCFISEYYNLTGDIFRLDHLHVVGAKAFVAR